MRGVQSIEVSWIDYEESDDEEEESVMSRYNNNHHSKRSTTNHSSSRPPRHLEEASPAEKYSSMYSSNGICNLKMKQLMDEQRLKESPYYDDNGNHNGTHTAINTTSTGSSLTGSGSESDTTTVTHADIIAAALWGSNNNINNNTNSDKPQDRTARTLDTTANTTIASSEDDRFLPIQTHSGHHALVHDDSDHLSLLSTCSPIPHPNELWTRAFSLLELEDQEQDIHELLLENDPALLTRDNDELLRNEYYETRELLSISPIASKEEEDSLASTYTTGTTTTSIASASFEGHPSRLVMDPRTKTRGTLPNVQAIEVVYDPSLFPRNDEEDGVGRRVCWPGRRRKPARHGFYR